MGYRLWYSYELEPHDVFGWFPTPNSRSDKLMSRPRAMLSILSKLGLADPSSNLTK